MHICGCGRLPGGGPGGAGGQAAQFAGDLCSVTPTIAYFEYSQVIVIGGRAERGGLCPGEPMLQRRFGCYPGYGVAAMALGKGPMASTRAANGILRTTSADC